MKNSSEKGFNLLWDKYENGGQSTVLELNGKVYKIYELRGGNKEDFDSLTEKELKKYVEKQNIYAGRKYSFDVNEFEHNGQKIKKIEFEVLKLPDNFLHGCDLYTRKNVLVSEIPFIKGPTLADFYDREIFEDDIFGLFFDFFLDTEEKKIINMLFRGIEKELEKVHKIEGGIRRHLMQENIKIVGAEEGVMKLMITDISGNIRSFANNLPNTIEKVQGNLQILLEPCITNFTISIKDLEENKLPPNISLEFLFKIAEYKGEILSKGYEIVELDFTNGVFTYSEV